MAKFYKTKLGNSTIETNIELANEEIILNEEVFQSIPQINYDSVVTSLSQSPDPIDSLNVPETLIIEKLIEVPVEVIRHVDRIEYIDRVEYIHVPAPSEHENTVKIDALQASLNDAADKAHSQALQFKQQVEFLRAVSDSKEAHLNAEVDELKNKVTKLQILSLVLGLIILTIAFI